MAKRTLCFVLLLLLVVCSDSEVTLVKTIGSKPDVTPLCTNDTLNTITLIVCKIRKGGEECGLFYRQGHDFEHNCDSRFRLMTKNQVVFLHLNGLTSEDSGIYTCDCSVTNGTYITHLNITVKESEDAGNHARDHVFPLFGATTVVIITAVILGFIYSRIRHRKPLSSPPNMEPLDIEPYSTFIQRESGLYSTARVHCSNPNN
uniref:uncharacterized protein n=1 Tax=Semicossyphus pulcher TaxID=241346 RepID=UPI0037E81F08